MSRDAFSAGGRGPLYSENMSDEPNLCTLGSGLPLKTTEETLAELRRENFRLRLVCFDYEKARRRLVDPQDAESSRLFSIEAENLNLKDVIAEKTSLLRSASKMIDVLKEENDSFREQLAESKRRLDATEHDWQEKYDHLYTELQQARQALRTNERRSLSQEFESNKQKNELRSRICELETSVEANESELDRSRRKVEVLQSEVAQMRSAIEQLSGEQPGLDNSQAALEDISRNLHISCRRRIYEVTAIVQALIQQITDAGLTPNIANLPANLSVPDWWGCDGMNRKPLSELATLSNQAEASSSSSSNKNTHSNGTGVLPESHMMDTGNSIAWLSERLNAARRLILDLGNQKLRQDTVVSDLKSSNEHLHTRVTDLLAQIDELMLVRGRLISESEQSQEQIRRLLRERAALQDHFTKELKEKERTIERLHLVLSVVNGAGDVTQYTIPNDDDISASLMPETADRSGVTMPSARLLVSMGADENDAECSVMHQMLMSVSHTGSAHPQPISSNSTCDAHQQNLVHSPRRRSKTFTLDPMPAEEEVQATEKSATPAQPRGSAKSDDRLAEIGALQDELTSVRKQLTRQIEEYARLKKAYDVLATASITNMASLGSDAITSLDATKGVANSASSSSDVGSLADLPTVSTPPPPLSGSPNGDATHLNELIGSKSLADSARNLSSPDASCTTLDVDESVASHPRDKASAVNSTSVLMSTRNVEQMALSVSGVLHSVDVRPALNRSLSGILLDSSFDRVPQNTPERSGLLCHTDPESLIRLRDLYNLVHGLKEQLDNVRFTQHSFVELVNRSLCTSGLDMSQLFTPSKTRAYKLTDPVGVVAGSTENVAVGCSYASLPARDPRCCGSSKPSIANATYGGTHTLLDNLEGTNGFTDADKSFASATGLNRTLADLRSYPTSPAPKEKSIVKHSVSGIPVLSSHGGLQRKLPIARVKATLTNQSASVSFTEGLVSTFGPPAESHASLTTQSFVEHGASSPPSVRGIGDLTMMEWQNQELFERLAQATAKLRDALEECAEVGSHLWGSGDMSQCMPQLPPNSACQSEAPVSINLPKQLSEPATQTPAHPPLDLTIGLTNRSVRFDRIDPNLVPSDFAQLSADNSHLSQLYDPTWRAPESSWSERWSNKVSTETQTSVGKQQSTQPLSFSSDVVTLHRFVSLLTHALNIMHQTIRQCNAVPNSDFDGPSVGWLTSWTESATHWFQSYLDTLVQSEHTSKSSITVTHSVSEKEDIACLLESLERVFNDQIDDWVANTRHRLQQLSDLEVQHAAKLALVDKSIMAEDQSLDIERFRLSTQLDNIRSLIPSDIVSWCADDVVSQVAELCEALNRRKQTIDDMERRHKAILPECKKWKQKFQSTLEELNNLSSQTQHQLEFQITALRTDFEREMKEYVCENEHLKAEMDRYKLLHGQVTQSLRSRDIEVNELSDQLRTMEFELHGLRASVAAEAANAQAAVSAACGYEERAHVLANELESLRLEHAQCMASRPMLISAQTSPVGKSRSADELVSELSRTYGMCSAGLESQNVASRLRKYGELKAVAYEIKEKLIRRTDKLETAQTEVARLRSVIQQDKEHASRVLEEVEDLRKQAIRKNRRIRDLEAEVAHLKASAGHVPVSSAPNTRSSARTVSDLEQPRGTQCRNQLSELGHNYTGSLYVSPLSDGVVPSIQHTELKRRMQPMPNSPLFISSDHIAEREVTSTVPDTSASNACKHCEELQILVVSLQNLSNELQRRLDCDLREEYSLLATLNSLDPHPASVEAGASRSSSVSDLVRDSSVQVSLLSTSMDDLRVNIQSLHHARTQLKHYATEMDRICSTVVLRVQNVEGWVDRPKGTIDAENDVSPVSRSVDSLNHLYLDLRVLVRNIDENQRPVVKQLVYSVKTIISELSVFIANANRRPGEREEEEAEDKENRTPLQPHFRDSIEVRNRNKQKELARRADRYHRRYRYLARGLDTMAQELTETADVLSAARTNLERTTGLSGLNHTNSSPSMD